MGTIAEQLKLNFFSMQFLLFFIIFPSLISSMEDSELKIKYLDKLIRCAFQKTKTYEVRKDNSDLLENANNMTNIHDYGTFDFIVVGAGSSGSIVASRLSEIEKWKVLLLEAGDWDDDLTDIPYIYTMLQFSDRNWGYYTIPQKHGCFGRKNNQCHYARGKVLGGSGSINGLGYMRGNKGDYDKWAISGNPGWSFNDLLPYFKKMENFESDKINLNYRGFAGPINVAYKKPEKDFFNYALVASELGIQLTEDYNSEDQMGISRQQRNIKFGKRVSGATAYVRPSMNRHNFNLTLQAFVTKITFDETSKTANGVLFVKNGRMYKAKASNEVILSGGAVNSPQLLMLSGIGPKEELEKHKIHSVATLPVGEYLKDHYAFEVVYTTNYTTPKQSFTELLREFLQGMGVLTSLDSGMIYINAREESSSLPNIEIILDGVSPVPKPVPVVTNYIERVEEYHQSINQQSDFRVLIFLLHPNATGSVRLQSSDPKDFPLIDTGIFSKEEDIEEIYEALNFLNKLEQTTSFRKVNATKKIMPFCGKYEFDSKEYWYCAIQHIAFPALHISSTAKMGPRTDRFAVVDNELKLYGIRNLRVADCSIMPTPIAGHTNAAAFVIGEKAADLEKRKYVREL